MFGVSRFGTGTGGAKTIGAIVISLMQVTKAYRMSRGVHVVLNNLSAEFSNGCNVGIIGRNGAGKSTLMRLISGAESPDSGSIHRRGRVSWPVGFSGGFSGSLTGSENARFVARIYGMPVDRVLPFAVEFSELGEYFDMPVKTYSSGMRARLAFALSMAIDFDVYLVDEVTAVGDSQFQKKCRAAFDERRDRSTLIIVSHDMTTIRDYCDICAVLEHGSLRFCDTIDEAQRLYES